MASSPCVSPQLCLRKHHKNGHISLSHLKDGYSSLERLNRRPKIKKCSLEKAFARGPSLEMIPTALEASAGGATICNSGSNSSGEEEGDILSDSREFDSKKRSTALVRRYCRNNEKVFTVFFFTDNPLKNNSYPLNFSYIITNVSVSFWILSKK